MDLASAASMASLVAGLASAVFWIRAATCKAPPPSDFEGIQNADTWKATIVNGGELYGTLRMQAKWNSWAAWAASAAVVLQIATNSLT